MEAIVIQNLKKYFGRTKAVDDISLTVPAGQIFGFLGPNGAGKTTTIRCLMDFIRPDSGQINILGQDANAGLVGIKKKIGYLSGYVRLYQRWTGRDHISFFQRLNGQAGSAAELIERLDFDPTKRAGQLSSGNKQKLGLILAFMNNPELLILDEPTIGLDPLLQNEIYKLLRERLAKGATAFLSSHNLPEVEKICTRVGIIRAGKLVTVERIDELKAKKIYRVHIAAKGGINLEKIVRPGIIAQRETDGDVTLSVRGEIGPVVRLLAALDLTELTIERAPLEEIFMEYYEA